ncbi:DUF2271 domain-containing protein [Pseudoalteromonas fuliginea]|uniref:FAD:protein FMN transferase n=1 Tax=Pseudoalteromonas fuliginea TaxID=1872678 RepID=A0ABQ6RF95_9GAMM|nr:DUF2271 domain-containing protein [Pseudoalteromonas fuliginea]KAA1152153.1 DUF2271 domain-containing protein [Pseudoalteromonas fuliginea]KAA1166250.1 DUF2271 domain-containing protein [Pseudoalteromonas fuliginea]
MLKKIFGAALLLIFNTQPVLAMVNAHYDNVLGTSMDISIAGVPQLQAEKAIGSTLNEITRLEGILSTWQKESQISLLNKLGSKQNLPSELIEIVELCEKWHAASHKKFSCKMGKLKELWLAAERTDSVPDRIAVRYKARDIQRSTINIDAVKNSVILDEKIALDPAGLAKGFIIDLAYAHLHSLLPDATGLKLDIGGDAYYWGKPNNNAKWHVAIADPTNLNDAQSAAPYYVNLSNMAIASSSHHNRFRQIQRRKFSHILDPQDGWPMDYAPSATVIAKDAVTADAIATALSTQSISQGIDWVNQLENVEALIVSPQGLKVASAGWHTFVGSETEAIDELSANSLQIEYQIPNLQVAKYEKPYVAIWISDRQNRSVYNLLLLGESNRWAKENSRWWRRVGRKNPDLLDGIARPTRRPGEYKVIWSGLNNNGEFDRKAKYYLNIEAAREGGGHNYKRIEFEFSPHTESASLPKKLVIPAKGELGIVSITYKTTNNNRL